MPNTALLVQVEVCVVGEGMDSTGLWRTALANM